MCRLWEHIVGTSSRMHRINGAYLKDPWKCKCEYSIMKINEKYNKKNIDGKKWLLWYFTFMA